MYLLKNVCLSGMELEGHISTIYRIIFTEFRVPISSRNSIKLKISEIAWRLLNLLFPIEEI